MLTLSSIIYVSTVSVQIPATSTMNCSSLSWSATLWLKRILLLSQGSSRDSCDVKRTSYNPKAISLASEHFVATNVSQALCTLGIAPGLFTASTYSWTKAARPKRGKTVRLLVRLFILFCLFACLFFYQWISLQRCIFVNICGFTHVNWSKCHLLLSIIETHGLEIITIMHYKITSKRMIRWKYV